MENSKSFDDGIFAYGRPQMLLDDSSIWVVPRLSSKCAKAAARQAGLSLDPPREMPMSQNGFGFDQGSAGGDRGDDPPPSQRRGDGVPRDYLGAQIREAIISIDVMRVSRAAPARRTSLIERG
jgi:hypothetical protein